MAKHKCGTCRFFQEAGLAGSGWCHHPQRKVSSDVMIMVRRNELACRDEWAKSLWEPAAGGGEAEKSFERAANRGPAAPASLDNVRSLLSADASVASSTMHGEDVLLSEGRIVSDAPYSQAPERPRPSGGFDPRTAVIKAREAYRERSRAKEAAARKSAGIEALEEVGRSFRPRGAQAAEDRSEWGTEPNGSWIKSENVERLETSTPPADAGAEPALHRSRAEDVTLPEPELGQRPINDDRELEDGAPRQEIEVVEVIRHAESTTPEGVGEQTEQELPEWFRTDLPRICRTCRDYRPAADGGRGWCANAWAFTHRRLVQDDDAAPCGSAVGDWWAPVDDVWLVAADVSSHSRATPLLDRLTAEDRSQRRRS